MACPSFYFTMGHKYDAVQKTPDYLLEKHS